MRRVQDNTPNLLRKLPNLLFAEAIGFEPMGPYEPTVFETVSLNHSDTPPWCARRGSNPQPPDPQSGVLSIELRAQYGYFNIIKIATSLSATGNDEIVIYLYFPAGNVFEEIQTIFPSRIYIALPQRAKIWPQFF